MGRKNIKKLIIRLFIIVPSSILTIILLFYFFKPCNIENWQVDINTEKWFISQEVSKNIRDLKVTKSTNINKYRSALIEKAIIEGIPKSEILQVLDISDTQGPSIKIPVYIKTSRRENIPIIIVSYKYQFRRGGWGAEWEGQWSVVIQRSNNKIIYSDGIL
jgi:hypothetical protein